ncbi:hypothetical protein Agub_g2819, partial [Astrephomene gubernaculifera]
SSPPPPPSPSPPPPRAPSRSSSRPLRLFLYNAEAALTRQLLEQLGLGRRVEVVEELNRAQAIVAAKMNRKGKHVNLTQGERTAANTGLPFLVVGRHMTASNLAAALQPLLPPGLLPPGPQAGAADTGTTAAAGGGGAAEGGDDGVGGGSGGGGAAGAAAGGRGVPSAAELRAHRAEMMQGFAQFARASHQQKQELHS